MIEFNFQERNNVVIFSYVHYVSRPNYFADKIKGHGLHQSRVSVFQLTLFQNQLTDFKHL